MPLQVSCEAKARAIWPSGSSSEFGVKLTPWSSQGRGDPRSNQGKELVRADGEARVGVHLPEEAQRRAAVARHRGGGCAWGSRHRDRGNGCLGNWHILGGFCGGRGRPRGCGVFRGGDACGGCRCIREDYKQRGCIVGTDSFDCDRGAADGALGAPGGQRFVRKVGAAEFGEARNATPAGQRRLARKQQCPLGCEQRGRLGRACERTPSAFSQRQVRPNRFR